MFEHSLYEPEIEAAPLQQGDLFYHYEIKSWELSSRLYRILAISAFANILAILVVAQTSLLTMKGCDSPLVNSVCQALDVVQVGTMVFGTQRDYVDVAYDPTRISEDEDVTFVDVTGQAPPLSYPEGYFQIANPEQFQTPTYTDINGNPLSSIDDLAGTPITPPVTGGGSLIDTTPNFPKPNPNVVEGPLPSFNDPGFGPNRKYNRGGKVTFPSNKPDVDDKAVANANTKPVKPSKSPEASPTPMSTEAVNAVEINKKPLSDFADDVASKWTSQQVDLNQNFTLVLNATITPDGKLDKNPKKTGWDTQKTTGDQKMIDVGKAALEALGESGYLTYLKSVGIDQITATLTQDDQQITVQIVSAAKTLERAKTLESLMGGIITVGKLKVDNPSDERTLLDGAKVASDGKNFILNFTLPKAQAQEMITRKLKEANAKKQQAQPNGTATAKPSNSNGN